jgi:hypothetical protein
MVVKLDRELLAAFAHTFITRWDRYAVQRIDGRYLAIKERLALEMIEAHIRGVMTLGAYALSEASQARWVCYDADDADEWEKLCNLAHMLAFEGVTPYLERSRRGGHLWLFMNPLSGCDARRFAKQLIAGCGLENIEIYPKQDALKTGPGSAVRLPLGIHRKTDKRYYFVNLYSDPLAPTIREQLLILSSPNRVSDRFIHTILKSAPEPKLYYPKFQHQLEETMGDTPIERVKNAISVYDFVSQFVQLDRGGRGLCPFHDDHIESFSVNKEENYWNCFAGCGGGDIIHFWRKWRELHDQSADFNSTLAELIEILF